MMYLLYHFSNKPISYSLEESSSLVLSSSSSTLALEVDVFKEMLLFSSLTLSLFFSLA